MKTKTDKQAELAQIESYVRSHFRDFTLAENAIYFSGLRVLEQRNGGMYSKILKSEDDWVQVCSASRKTVRENLKKLHKRHLIHYTKGSNGSEDGKRKTSIVKRSTLEEIQKSASREVLHRFAPAEMEELLEKIKTRDIPWKQGSIKPKWSLAITGRLIHKDSPLTAPYTNTKDYRLKAFRGNLRNDEVLLECDWKAAEPSVICHVLFNKRYLDKTIEPTSIYQALQEYAQYTKDQAKREFNKVAYSSYKTISVPEPWNLPANHFLRGFVEEIDEYRQVLWKKGIPHNGNRRFVRTLTGRKIVHDGKKRIHRGKALAWQIQGTIADIHTKVVNHILEDEAKGLCRFFFPCHDAVWLAVKQNSDYDPASTELVNKNETFFLDNFQATFLFGLLIHADLGIVGG